MKDFPNHHAKLGMSANESSHEGFERQHFQRCSSSLSSGENGIEFYDEKKEPFVLVVS